MKIQYIAVIFVIIIIPISLIMSQYIQTQIKTITLQTAYTKNLDNATHDAMQAFQINSINNKYSSISESKIRDIEASIQTFYNSLGTSMDTYISAENQLSGFVPAILFTLYDGYYIYSLYEDKYEEIPLDPDNLNDSHNVKVNILDEGVYEEGLHPYIYYSAKYKLGNDIIVVNYTLDNEITVYGNLKDTDGSKKYLTKSGYLIDPQKVGRITLDQKKIVYDGIEIGPETLKEHLMTFEEDSYGNIGEKREQDYQYIIYKNQKVYLDIDERGNILYTSVQVPVYSGSNITGYTTTNLPRLFWYDEYKKKYLQSETANIYLEYFNGNINKMRAFQSTSAFQYYYEAYEFSTWVQESGLQNIRQSDLIRMEDGATPIGNDIEYLSTDIGNNYIFKTANSQINGNDPLLASSTFNAHREAIIRKSIETNLGTAIANYTKFNNFSTFEFRLPKINEENWNQICNNVSIISFMQGIPIGMKYFNNYSVITSTKNEEVINSQNIYIIAEDSSGNRIYHQPGCEELIQGVNSGVYNTNLEAYAILSFQRQTARVPDREVNYFYPQTRITIDGNKKILTGCYNCIVNATADYDVDSIVKGEIRNYSTNALIHGPGKIQKIKQIYLQALARERFDIYKSNFDLR